MILSAYIFRLLSRHHQLLFNRIFVVTPEMFSTQETCCGITGRVLNEEQ